VGKPENRACALAVLLLAAAAAASADGPAPSISQTAELDFREIIANAKKEVFPSLIFVKPIIEQFGSGERKQLEVFGSGIVISPDGYAITNHHVIDNAVAINCVLEDKRQVKAVLVGSDQDTDLALLKLPHGDGDPPMPYARFASEQVSSGDFVMALGSPFGFQRSISLGIVSNAERYIGFQTEYKYNTWLQTDAAINPGNSGGPLINTRGEVVGINTLGVSGASVGFSIPGKIVQSTVERLKRDGKIVRAHTGLRLQALKDFHSNTFLDAEHGVLVTGVEDNSPAAEAGVRAGDILIEVAGSPVEGMYAEMLPRIWRCLADLPLDEESQLKVARGKETVTFTLIPTAKGKLEGDDFDCPRWKMTVKEINKYREPRLHYMYGDGIYIQGVKYPGNASDAGLHGGDVIVKVDGKPTGSLEEYKKLYESIIAEEDREKKVMFEIKRSGLTRWIVLDYQKDYDEE